VPGLHDGEPSGSTALPWSQQIRPSSEAAGDYHLTELWWEQPDAQVHGDVSDEALNSFGNEIVDVTGLDGRQRVLEIGCGDGRVSERLLPHVAALSAFDFSQHLVASAQRRLAGCEVWRQSFLDPMPSGFDVVMSFGVLQYAHPNDLVPLLRNSLASARPGGLVAHMSVPDRRKRRHLFLVVGLRGRQGIRRLTGRGRALLALARSVASPSKAVWDDGTHIHDLRGAAAALSTEADVRIVDSSYDPYRSSILLTRPEAESGGVISGETLGH
jgi:SAM-dependent methyltransferase